MSKKRPKNNGILFCGKAAEEVTGSQIYIQFGESKLLIECGLYQSQSNDYLDAYKINTEKFKFKPSELDYVFIAHAHIDHIGMLPRLIKEGFRGDIIATPKTALIMKPLLLNSCAILSEESRILSRRFKREYMPPYGEEDVYKALDMIQTYEEYETVFRLNQNVSFQWMPNGHCIGAAQLQLILKDGNCTKKILYTSDLGSLKPKNHYVDKTVIPQGYNDVVISESTYGEARRSNKKSRKFDMDHLKSAIDTVVGRGGTVILPCFSFSRTQEILTTIHDIYGDDENFSVPVVVDSRLSCEICELYKNLLNGEDLLKWKDICQWNNLIFIKEKEDSLQCISDSKPKIVISSSGFCTNGRIVDYLKHYIRDRNSMVIFTGYTGDNPSYLSYRIKNNRANKTIKINKEQIPNRADCITLATFSSHANFDDLVKYGSSLNTNKLILVHGSTEAKKCLAEKLREEISNNDKTYRVLESHRGMIVRL